MRVGAFSGSLSFIIYRKTIWRLKAGDVNVCAAVLGCWYDWGAFWLNGCVNRCPNADGCFSLNRRVRGGRRGDGSNIFYLDSVLSSVAGVLDSGEEVGGDQYSDAGDDDGWFECCGTDVA